MKKKKSNGMILITTMLFITIIVMIATLIAVQGKSALQNGNLSLQSEEAYLAALSGIDYVRGELRKNQNFGTADLSEFSSNLPQSAVNGFIVKYNGKNLTGYLGYNSDNDYKSKFSISFDEPNATEQTTGGNYKHTSSDCKYPSLNNLNTSTKVEGYRRDVPAYSIYIVSKGVCGKAVRYAEAFLTSDSSPTIDGGTTIGGKINIRGTANDYTKGTSSEEYKDKNSLLTVEHVNTSLPGKLTAFNTSDGRAINNISLTSNGGNDIYDLLNLTNSVQLNGKVNNIESISKPTDAYLQQLWSNLNINQGNTVDTDDLKSLTFEKVINNVGTNLNFSSTTDENGEVTSTSVENSYTLTPGTYAYIRETDENRGVNGYWKFVNTQYVDSIEYILNNSYSSYVKDINEVIAGGISFGSKPLNAFNGGNSTAETRTVTLSGNVYSQNNVNFAIVDKINTTIEKDGNTQTTTTYKLADSSVDFHVNGGSLISYGDIYINGEVVGYGNLISNGNITFNAGSSLEVDENQKVAVWAKGDVNIKRATNVSNDSLVEIFNEAYNNNGKENTSNNNVDISDIQNNRLLTGIIGDQIREEAGMAESNVLGDIEVTDYGPNFVTLNFVYNNYIYEFVRLSDSKITVSYFQRGVATQAPPSEIIEDCNGKKEKTINNAIHVVCRQDKTETNDNQNLGDFNVFIKKDNKYYYFTTLDFNNKTDNGLFFKATTYEGVGYLDGSTIKSEYEAGNVSDNVSALKVETVASSNDSKTAVETEANTETALITTIVNANTKLKGTVYSREGDINIDIGTTDFDIIGALVTSGGDLDIKAGHVHLKYDPNYVPFFKDASGVKTNVRFLSSFIGGFEN